LYGADAIIQNPLFSRKGRKGESYIGNIITGAGATKGTPYGAEVTGGVLPPGERRKAKAINVLPPGNAGGGSKGNAATGGHRTGRTP